MSGPPSLIPPLSIYFLVEILGQYLQKLAGIITLIYTCIGSTVLKYGRSHQGMRSREKMQKESQYQ
jgi:hypothetical protein